MAETSVDLAGNSRYDCQRIIKKREVISSPYFTIYPFSLFETTDNQPLSNPSALAQVGRWNKK
jgi:hypothetical protein